INFITKVYVGPPLLASTSAQGERWTRIGGHELEWHPAEAAVHEQTDADLVSELRRLRERQGILGPPARAPRPNRRSRHEDRHQGHAAARELRPPNRRVPLCARGDLQRRSGRA